MLSLYLTLLWFYLTLPHSTMALLDSTANFLSSRPLLKRLITSAMESTAPPLTPLQPFLNIPGGPLLVSMEGHRNTVSCIASTILPTETGKLSLCIVSSSWDGTLKSWDLDSTGVLKTFDGHTDKVVSIALTLDGQYAVSGSADETVRLVVLTFSRNSFSVYIFISSSLLASIGTGMFPLVAAYTP